MHDSQFLHFFGQRLRKIRRGRHLSQEDLAERLGVRQDTISDYERGKCRPPADFIWRIATVLRVDVGYFFPRDDFASLSPEERDTLALLESFSPLTLKYTLSLIQGFVSYQQQRLFLSEVMSELESDISLRTMLECEVSQFEANLKSGTMCPVDALVRLNLLLFMCLEMSKGSSETNDIVRRLVACGQRLIYSVDQRGASA
jgi:transcriptional regulator with XRE-family HTH domain